MADQPWHELPPEIVAGPAPELADVRRRDDRGRRERPGVRSAARGAVGRRYPGRGPGGAAPLPGRDRGGRSRRPARRLLGPRAGARCAPGAAWNRCSAPTGSARGSPGGVSPPPACEAGLEPDTLYLLAESIFAYIDVLSAESAEGHALEQSAAASEAELRRRRLVRMLVREPRSTPPRSRRRRADAGWALPRTLAVLAIGGEQRGAAASRLPAGTISEAIGELTCAIVADPDGPGPAARRSSGRSTRRRRPRRAWVRRSTGPRPRISFVRARAALELAGADAPAGRARERAGELLLRSDPGSPASWPPIGSHRSTGSRPGRAQRLSETLRVAGRAGTAAQVAERLGVAPADGALPARRGCASCSAGRSTIPTGGSGWSWRCGRRRQRRAGRPQRRPEARVRGSGSGSGSRRDLGSERTGGELVVPRVGDRDLVLPGVARRGTRSSPGPPSTRYQSALVSNQVIWVIL